MSTEVFNREKAEATVKVLRQSFLSGKTKPYEWRASQLKSIVRLIEEKERDITEALQSDLDKPGMETYLHEVNFAFVFTFLSIFARKSLKKMEIDGLIT